MVTPSQTNAPPLVLPTTSTRADYATIFGFLIVTFLLVYAISSGESNASFLNGPSLAIVVFGTMAVTAISFSVGELRQSVSILGKSMAQKVYSPSALARALLEIAVTAKTKGVLTLSQYDPIFARIPFLARAMQMVVDGQNEKDINFALSQSIASLVERHKRAASLTRRAAETAPAMGLIGTLVGLVQMLADLENPETIGPAMAIALLTTFYGAIIGTVIMSPLSGKLDKLSQDEALVKNMIRLCSCSISRQDNPRKLETELNAVLPPSERIQFFD